MTQTRWEVERPDGTRLELGGRKFSSSDEEAPMTCNRVCTSMGRHVHISYCHAADGDPCDGADVQHIKERMTPNPNKPKDAITHALFWRRMGGLTLLFSYIHLGYSAVPRLQRLRAHSLHQTKG
jgi:hypothetical protein